MCLSSTTRRDFLHKKWNFRASERKGLEPKKKTEECRTNVIENRNSKQNRKDDERDDGHVRDGERVRDGGHEIWLALEMMDMWRW